MLSNLKYKLLKLWESSKLYNKKQNFRFSFLNKRYIYLITYYIRINRFSSKKIRKVTWTRVTIPLLLDFWRLMISSIVFPFFIRSASRVPPFSKVLLARAPFTAIRRRKRRLRHRRRKKQNATKSRRRERQCEGKTGFLYAVMMAMPSMRRHQRGDVYTHVAGCRD